MRKSTSAMSMVEIMIGVILLALMIVPSLNAILSQTKTVTSTRDHSQAAFVVQKLQEVLRSYNFRMIEADQYSSDPVKQKKTFEWKLKNSDELKKHVINGIEYLIDPDEVKIDKVKNTLEGPDQVAAAYLVRFAINYTSKDGRPHTIKISTAISLRD